MPMNPPGRFSILVAVETDATRYHGENARRPRQLSHSDAEQMLAHLSADLSGLIPTINQCTIVSVGALFDQTQILRPEYPVFDALGGLLKPASGNGQESTHTPRLISLGSGQDGIPAKRLRPDAGIPIGPLQLLPLLVTGPDELVAELGQEMEHRFMEEGQVSAHTAGWMETAFDISITHGRFMTLTDLNAMFRMQLEHFGFLPLWELIDAALMGAAGPLEVSTGLGLAFRWDSGRVVNPFQSFDYWSQEGDGRQMAAHKQQLAGAYADWTRELRRYVTTLEAHTVPLEFELPEPSGRFSPERFRMTETYCVEQAGVTSGRGAANITEHSFGDLGTVAVTVLADDGMSHYYPLSAAGLNDIHRDIRNTGDGRPMVAFPGSILYDEKTRRLRPDDS